MLDVWVEYVGVEFRSHISSHIGSLIRGINDRWSQDLMLEPRPKSELHVLQQVQHHQ